LKVRLGFAWIKCAERVSIPSRGFWFFEVLVDKHNAHFFSLPFQSPRGDFGFLKLSANLRTYTSSGISCFNPLAGILVF